MIESTEMKAMFEIRSEHDFTAEPQAIDIGSAKSLLASLSAGE